MTFPTASKSMQALVSLGIAGELTGQRRNCVFVYDASLNMLNEGGKPLEAAFAERRSGRYCSFFNSFSRPPVMG